MSPLSRKVWARLPAGLVLLGGLAWGLGLARVLFEQFPLELAFLGARPGALALAVLAAGLALGTWRAVARRAAVPAAAVLPLALPLVAIFDPAVNPLRLAALLLAGLALCLYLCSAEPLSRATNQGSRVNSHVSSVTGYESRITHYALRFTLHATRFTPPAIVFLVPFLLYLATLAPTVGEADTFEFQVDIVRLAVAHPSGYPLYLLIGKLFSLLPLPGSIAYRINLSSAFFGALAATGVYGIVQLLDRLNGGERGGTAGKEECRATERAQIPALIAGLTFGLSFGLWSRAVEAEVYTLHASFVAAILMVTLRILYRSSDARRGAEGVGRGARDGELITDHGLRITDYVLPTTHYTWRLTPHASRLTTTIPLLAFLFGLSLANHLTTALLAPAAAAALLIARPQLSWKTWLAAAGLFALGLSVYLYIPIRWPAVNNGEAMSLGQFAAYLTGQQAQGALRLNAWLADPGRYAIVGGKALAEFGLAGALLALAGLAWLLRHRATRPAALVLVLAYVAYFYFGLSFYVPDPDFSAFLLPAHLVESTLIGVGVAAVWRLTSGDWRGARSVPREGSGDRRITRYALRFTLCALVLALSLLLPLSLTWLNYSRVDQSRDWGRYELGRYIFGWPLNRGALVLADSEKIAPLYYLQVAEGVRSDLTISVLPDEAAYRAGLDEAIAQGRTVYLGRYLPGLQGSFHLRSAGPLTEVGVAPLTLPPPMALPAGILFGGSIRLLGANLAPVSPNGILSAAPGIGAAKHLALQAAEPLRNVMLSPPGAKPLALRAGTAPHPVIPSATKDLAFSLQQPLVEAGGPLRFTLYWQSEAPVDHNYLVRLRLVDSAGHPAQETLGRVPANGFYPTNAWRPGEIVPDFYQIELDAALAPGEHVLQVGLFPPFGDDGLQVEGSAGRDEEDSWATVMHVQVLPASRPPAIPVPARFAFSPLPTEQFPSGEGLGVRAGDASPVLMIGIDLPESAAPGSNVTASFFWVAPGGGSIRYSLDTHDGFPLAEASFNADLWPAGAIIKTQLVFRTPAEARALPLQLAVAGRSARCGWLRPNTTSCALPILQVEGEAAAPGAVNFADKILLRSLGLDTPQARPGEVVRVRLEWQALASMTDDYTAFVHLLGPDGLVHGQVDAWPVQGTRPTSGWRPGERLLDAYEIRVPDDAPPGDYQVEVGWYLLATLERLPVLGEGGAVVDDRVLREGLVIAGP